MLGALMLLGLQDALAKHLSAWMSIWQFQLLRTLVNLSVVTGLTLSLRSATELVPRRLPFVALRSTLHVMAILLFFSAAPFLTLTEMAAGLYTFPLFVAAFTALLPGERVGPRRLLAIAIGFTGALLILKPGSDQFSPVSLLPVCAGFCYSLFILCTRRLCRDESPAALVMGSNCGLLTVALCGICWLSLFPLPADVANSNRYFLTPWQPLAGWMLGIIVLCGVLNSVSNLALSKAYQSAESSMLAPFDYSYLVFATFWGFVFWHDVPTPSVLLGVCLIAFGGIFIAWRERIALSRSE